MPSKDYFGLERQLQNCRTHGEDLSAQLKAVKKELRDSKVDGDKRVADALQRAGIEARQIYGPQVTRLQQDAGAVPSPLAAAQLAAHPEQSLLNEHIADLIQDLNEQKKRCATRNICNVGCLDL